MELMHLTGCRVSDAVLIGPQMVGRDGVLAYRQNKTGAQAFVPWTCPLPAYAAGVEADRAMCHAALAPFAGQMTFLATAQGKTRSAKALSTVMQQACREVGIPVSAHGLRKARAVALAEGGATTHQQNAWTGHQTLTEASRYTESMDRRRAVMGTAPEPLVETTPDPIGNQARK
jgi:integrase